jgi:LysM repeat protein
MRKKMISILVLLVVFAFVSLALDNPASASPVFQMTPFPTPTPNAEGAIIYVVQPGDTLWRIAAVSGVSLEELRVLNGMDEDDVIVEEQELLLGTGGPVTQGTEEAPTEVPTPSEPTSTIGPGTGEVCVMLYNDVNGDSMRQESEVSIPGAAISVSERTGQYSSTANTEEIADPVCFGEDGDMPEGDYNVTVAIPDGYNPTTVLSKAFELTAGDEVILNFGAQEGTEVIVEAPPPEEGGRSPILGAIGIALVLFGVGVGIFSARLAKKN